MRAEPVAQADEPGEARAEGFFDDRYLLTYGQLQTEEDSRAEALAALELAGCPPGSRVLDAPCGYGRHAIPLAEAGYRVAGVDLSAPLLVEARRRAPDPANPELVRADYRSLPYTNGTFQAVLCLYNSLGYLGDEGDRQVLTELRRVLAPGRCLVVSIHHRDRVVLTFRPHSWHRLRDGRLFLEEASFDPVEGLLSMRHTLVVPGKPASCRALRLRVYSATELVRLAQAAGFTRTECYGDWQRSPLSAESPLAVLLAR